MGYLPKFGGCRVLGTLDKLKIPKEELISGIVFAIIIAFLLPPVGLMLLLAFFGL